MTEIKDFVKPIYKGQTSPIRFDALVDVGGDLITDFTGMAFELEIAVDRNTDPEITIPNAEFTPDEANSLVDCELSSTQTAALTAGDNAYVYSLHIFTDAGVKMYVPVRGNISVEDSLLD